MKYKNVCIAGIHAASHEVSSTCNNRLVCCIVIYVYIAGINAASQEVFSRTRGVGIHLAIKYYCVLLCSRETPARYSTVTDTSIKH